MINSNQKTLWTRLLDLRSKLLGAGIQVEVFDLMKSRLKPGDQVHFFGGIDFETWIQVTQFGCQVRYTPLTQEEQKAFQPTWVDSIFMLLKSWFPSMPVGLIGVWLKLKSNASGANGIRWVALEQLETEYEKGPTG